MTEALLVFLILGGLGTAVFYAVLLLGGKGDRPLMDPKPKSQSKTLWVNYVALIGAVLALPQLAAVLPPEAIPILALITPVVNIILRHLTDRPITPIDIGGLFRLR